MEIYFTIICVGSAVDHVEEVVEFVQLQESIIRKIKYAENMLNITIFKTCKQFLNRVTKHLRIQFLILLVFVKDLKNTKVNFILLRYFEINDITKFIKLLFNDLAYLKYNFLGRMKSLMKMQIFITVIIAVATFIGCFITLDIYTSICPLLKFCKVEGDNFAIQEHC